MYVWKINFNSCGMENMMLSENFSFIHAEAMITNYNKLKKLTKI